MVTSDNSMVGEKPSKIRIWFTELRVPFLTASIIPILLGTAVAWATTGTIFWDVFALTLTAGVCVHAGANVANDYFDHKSGTDDINIEFVRPFSGGSRMIQLGLLSPREVLTGSLVLFIIGGLLGMYLAFYRGFFVLILGIIGVFSGFFYTAPPFRFASRGVGELFVGINFGVLMTLGAFYVQTQVLTWQPVMASLPVAILITAILYINEFPDFTADFESGKRTLVVRLGRRKAAKVFAIMMIAVHLTIILSIVLEFMTPYQLMGLVTLPLSYLGIRQALMSYDNPIELIPAYASTVLNHLLTGLSLVVAYILQGFAIAYPFAILSAIVLAAIVLIQTLKIWKQIP
jgi:1,4-dihydroxy-2-naphthoate octaprenyltransferase